MTADVHVAVVSSGRSGNVPALQALFPDHGLTWYVPADQAGEYRYAGATTVTPVDTAGTLGPARQRNAALDVGHAAGAVVVTTDDDLRRCACTEPGPTNEKHPVDGSQAVRLLVEALEASPYLHGGVGPTDNAFFARRAHTTDAFVRSGFNAHRPNPLRYDEALPLKEDYDMTLQHLAAHGGVLRLDTLLMTYQQRVKKGGCSYRTPEVEQQAIAHLVGKWGDVVRPHPRRANEVLLHWRPA